MSTWALRPILPRSTTFNGQIVFPMTGLYVPNSLKRYVESVDLTMGSGLLNKYTGFETAKYRSDSDNQLYTIATLAIMLVGDLPRWLQRLMLNLAKGCNGAGMELEFYDDWATMKQYTGRWTNAGDFVDSSELLCGGSIQFSAFSIQDI